GTVDLTGYERSGPWTIERFRTRPIEKLDLIWVIDSSQSMDEEQTKIARSLARFREVIADRRVDGRFAVTTMDLGGEGSCLREVGGLRWFDTGDNFDLAMDRFTEAVQVGTSGSTTESGVLAALVAAAGDRECNAGFRRQGASLEFVFVSDEEDQSPLSLETAVRWLSMLDARVHAVVGSNDRDLGEGRRGCIHPDPEPQRPFSGFSQGERSSLDTIAALGQRYRTLAAVTGGLATSICSEDFAEPVAQVALESAGARQRYGLALEPDPETITVQVDGVTRAETELGATFGWWFEPESQSILFGRDDIPEWPSQVAVRYMAR
ncbi:MAG: hypothetical protein VX405_09930, partial [Myxococcota bacterium]|nr:hypothetical protein [Myxococcota bacterium]